MTVKTHITTSALLSAATFLITSSTTMAMSALVSGVLIDLDHLIDFFIFSGERFSVQNLFEWCKTSWERSLFPFHSWEMYILFTLFTYHSPHPVQIGILLGVGVHLTLDQIGNRYFLKHDSIRPFFYFFIYRASKGFYKKRMLEEKINR